MNNQEVFDKVVMHLFSMKHQSRQSRPNDRGIKICAYRAEDGGRCAIGCLIPDSAYKAGMEGAGVKGLLSSNATIERLFKDVSPHLLSELQALHDTTYMWLPNDEGLDRSESVVSLLWNIAHDYELDAGVLYYG